MSLSLPSCGCTDHIVLWDVQLCTLSPGLELWVTFGYLASGRHLVPEPYPDVFSRKHRGCASSAERKTSRAQQSGTVSYLILQKVTYPWPCASPLGEAGRGGCLIFGRAKLLLAAEALFPVGKVEAVVQRRLRRGQGLP